MRVIACDSPYGRAGMGQHFAQLVEESRREGILKRYYAPDIKPEDSEKGRILRTPAWGSWFVRYTPLRFSSTWKNYILSQLFDRRVAARLEGVGKWFMGFAGTSLHSFRRARALGFEELELVTATSHIENVKRLQDKAKQQLGFGQSWLGGAQVRKTLGEYEMADVIYVHSEYTRQSFLAAGVKPSRLKRTYLQVHPRFEPPSERPDDDVFRIVYVGRVEVEKGIPLLLEAFSRLSGAEVELTIVGGWSTRSMRRFMQKWTQRDPRIRVAPGDPLPVLHQADVFVHPSFEDGFGYAPMEALACGVPVIATEDTGMKEYVREGDNGFVVPTGSWEAILERLQYIKRHPMAACTSLLSTEVVEESTT